MTKQEALEKLELEVGASQQDIKQQYQEFYNELKMRITNAPTTHLRKLYNRKQHELKEAFLLLTNLSKQVQKQDNEIDDLPGMEPKASYSNGLNEDDFEDEETQLKLGSHLLVSFLRDSFKMSILVHDHLTAENIPFWLEDNYKKKDLECGNTHVLSTFYRNFIAVLTDYIEKVKGIKIWTVICTLPLLKTGELKLMNALNDCCTRFMNPTSAMACYLVHSDSRYRNDIVELFLFIDGDYCEVNLIELGDGVIENLIRIRLPSITNTYMVDDYLKLVRGYCPRPISNIVVYGETGEHLTNFLSSVKQVFACKSVKDYFHKPPVLNGMAAQCGIFIGTVKDVLLLDCLANSYKIIASSGGEYDLFPYGYTIPSKISLTNKNADCKNIKFTIIECSNLFKENIFTISHVLKKTYKRPESLQLSIDIDANGKIYFHIENEWFAFDELVSVTETFDKSSEIILANKK